LQSSVTRDVTLQTASGKGQERPIVDNPDNIDDEAQGNVAEFTVTELSFAIKRAIEDGFSYVRVRGELGRIARPASGHVYLDLKDEKSVLSGIIWRGQAAKLKVQPEEGMEVIATGRLTTYPGQSRYQIIIDSIEPAGAGALLAQLEKLKKKLAGEGLFDEERKKPIPFMPRVVGIVTSPTGAVIRDMLHGFSERFPVRVIVWPVRVQGETSGAEVATAIRGFNALGEAGEMLRPDVLIVGRGGGSLEDLWGFNEEQVARAVAESEIPLISAVGHETDWTVIDLVADARAPTPTKAAEWAVPVYADLLERLGENRHRLGIAQRRSLDQRRIALKAASRGLPKLSDLLALPRQRFDSASGRLPRALLAGTRVHATRLTRASARLRPGMLAQQKQQARVTLNRNAERSLRALKLIVDTRRRTFDGRAKLLSTLGHHSVLARGFVLVRDGDGQMVRTAKSISSGDALEMEFVDGRVATTAVKVASTKTAAKPRSSRGSGGGPQGSLF
jgi:exodeoxyribonuclease VII large subunit